MFNLFILFKIKIHRENGTYFQGIRLANFNNANSFISKKKNKYMGTVGHCLSHHLENEEESEDVLDKVYLIHNCETWVKNDKKFTDGIIFRICEQFLILLKVAGMELSISNLLEQ